MLYLIWILQTKQINTMGCLTLYCKTISMFILILLLTGCQCFSVPNSTIINICLILVQKQVCSWQLMKTAVMVKRNEGNSYLCWCPASSTPLITCQTYLNLSTHQALLVSEFSTHPSSIHLLTHSYPSYTHTHPSSLPTDRQPDSTVAFKSKLKTKFFTLTFS